MRVTKLLLCCLIATAVVGQKPFEGRLLYKIEYEELPQGMEGLEKMLPSELDMIVKGANSRIEQNSVFGGKQVFLHWADGDSTVVLVDILEQKLKYILPTEERKAQKYRLTKTEETKEIKGLTCKKAVLQTSTGTVLEVWYTDEYLNPEGSEFPQLEGLPLEYELVRKGMTMRFTVKVFKEEPIDETYFAVPEEYVETSFERFSELMR